MSPRPVPGAARPEGPGAREARSPPVGDGAPRSRPARPRVLPALLGIAVYCLLGAWVGGLRDTVSSTHLPGCGCGDMTQAVWFLAWPAYALTHGLNPLFSQAVNVPHGYNVFDATSAPLLGVLAAPLTLTVGPVAAFNVMVRLAFAASAASMFLVLRRWTSWWPAAFAGGLLYGFSPFLVGEAGDGHLFAFFVPLPPLLLLLCDEWFARQRWPAWVTGGLFGLVAAAQMLVSLEVLADSLLLLALGAVVLLVRFHRLAWQRRRYLLLALGSALLVFGLLGGYPAWFYFAGPAHIHGLQHPSRVYQSMYDDLAGLVVPTVSERIGPHGWKLLGTAYARDNLGEDGSYLGVPLAALLVGFTFWLRRSAVVVTCALLGLAALVLTLGVRVHVAGSEHLGWLRLPYALLRLLPLAKGLLDVRLALLLYLFAAVVLAVGLDRLRLRPGLRERRAVRPAGSLACAALAVVVLAPLVPAVPYRRTAVAVPGFFTTRALVDQLPGRGVVLPYPDSDKLGKFVPDARSMLWQAVAGMRYRMIGVYGPRPGDRVDAAGDPVEPELSPTALPRLFAWARYGSLGAAPPPPPDPAELGLLRTFLRRYDVAAVVVQPVGAHPAVVLAYLTAALGAGPTREGGVDVWLHVPGLLAAASRAQIAR